ncbi:MAG: type II toxin-antitoxin system RelE/ParE family toxin, partial [Nitrosospira sp.]|nr:type II toxin-antitoxin system RelE/ParE family toxin [Nitrosospira sp.]
MKLIALPRFTRALKKLHPDEKRALDEAVRAIAVDPQIGEMRKGDLAGVRVYKHRCRTRLLLIAYRVAQDDGMIRLLAVGSHENFYRDLKR